MAAPIHLAEAEDENFSFGASKSNHCDDDDDDDDGGDGEEAASEGNATREIPVQVLSAIPTPILTPMSAFLLLAPQSTPQHPPKQPPAQPAKTAVGVNSGAESKPLTQPTDGAEESALQLPAGLQPPLVAETTECVTATQANHESANAQTTGKTPSQAAREKREKKRHNNAKRKKNYALARKTNPRQRNVAR